MTDTGKRTPPHEPPLVDPVLDAAWRAESDESPRKALDDAILAAAHRAVDAKPRDATGGDTRAAAREPERWWWPIAAAAAIGAVAFGVLQMAPSLAPTELVATDVPPAASKGGGSKPDDGRFVQGLTPRADLGAAKRVPTPTPAPAPTAPGPTAAMPDRASAQESVQPAAGAPRAVTPPANAGNAARAAQRPASPPDRASTPAPGASAQARLPSSDAAPRSAEAGESAPTSAAVPSERPGAPAAPAAPSAPAVAVPPNPVAPAAPPAAAVARSSPSETPRALEPRADRVPGAAASAALRASPQAEGAPRLAAAATANANRSPDAWIAEIAQLRRQGRDREAEASLRAFREAWNDADARLPPELRDWAATIRRP